MRIIVYGAGAVGSIIGGYLHQSDCETILVCSRTHTDAINRNGLEINSYRERYNFKIPAVSDIGQIQFRDDDVIFFTMKSYDTAPVLTRLGDDASRLTAVCFQNGIGNEPIIQKRIRNIYGGIVFFAAKYVQPGTVTHISENSIGVGKYPQGIDQKTKDLSSTLMLAGFKVTEYPNILAVKWSKLFYNLSNVLFAILGMSVREGFNQQKVRFLMADILDEACRVIEADGIDLLPMEGHRSPQEMITAIREPGERQYDVPEDDNMKLHPSTWQDLYLQRGRTEVDYINGEIVKLGQKNGMKTPLNSGLLEIATHMARDKIKPGSYTVDQLATLLRG